MNLVEEGILSLLVLPVLVVDDNALLKGKLSRVKAELKCLLVVLLSCKPRSIGRPLLRPLCRKASL